MFGPARALRHSPCVPTLHFSPSFVTRRRRWSWLQGSRPFDAVHPERSRRAQGRPRSLLRRFILFILSIVEGSGRSRRADRVRRLADSSRGHIRRRGRWSVRNAGYAREIAARATVDRIGETDGERTDVGSCTILGRGELTRSGRSGQSRGSETGRQISTSRYWISLSAEKTSMPSRIASLTMHICSDLRLNSSRV